MAEGRILPYLDIPLQHGSPRILKAMRRPAATERVLDRIHRWRSLCPDLTLRSAFIVGFPGETEADFETLLDFLREARLDRVGCFTYSPVDGAPANDLPGAVPEPVKEERMARFMEVQAGISRERLEAKVGRRLTVLVDALDEEGTAIARSGADAPEIDGLVFVEGETRLRPGDWAEVVVEDCSDHDLFARTV
ncbi:MAG: radical SAM protein, partial [Ectothiorhodospira sp.]